MNDETVTLWILAAPLIVAALLSITLVVQSKLAAHRVQQASFSPQNLTAPMGTTRCPNCKVWDHELHVDELPAWRYVETETSGEGGYDLKTCKRCKHTSAWIDGPGLMLNIPMPANAPKVTCDE